MKGYKPAPINSALLCREENLGEYVIVFMREGPGNSPDRPVHALSEVEGINIPRDIGEYETCEFTAPNPDFMVRIVTDREEFNAGENISSDSTPEMPEPVFEAQVISTGTGGVSFDWTLEMVYDEGNYEDIGDTTVTITETVSGDNTWEPDFGDLLAGGDIEVTVVASRAAGAGLEIDTAVKDGFMIRGENPRVEDIEEHIEDESDDDLWDEIDRGLKAMVWQESNFRQFNSPPGVTAPGGPADTPAFPLLSFDNGWGMTQLTSLDRVNQNRVWSWEDNLNEGMLFYEQIAEGAEGQIIDWRELHHSDELKETDWTWDPEDLTSKYQMRSDTNMGEIVMRVVEGDILAEDLDEGDTRIERVERDSEEYPYFDDNPDRNFEREQNWLDGEDVSKILNAQGYLRFNAGPNVFPALVGEFGTIRRLIGEQAWTNLEGYIESYDEKAWEDNG